MFCERIRGRIILRKIIFTFTLIAFFFGGCSANERDFNTLFCRLKNNPTSLDPAYVVDVDSGKIAAKLYSGLIKLNHETKIVPDIASSWKVSDDALEYTFYLRADAYFADGEKITAKDFKYSFERILNPATLSSRKWLFDNIVGAKDYIEGKSESVAGILILDDYTLKIVLEKPLVQFLTFLTMSSAYVVPYGFKTDDKDNSLPPASGPFMLFEWKHDNHLTLVKNPNYFGLKPQYGKLSYHILPEDLSAVSMFLMGDIDILEIPRSDIEMFLKNPMHKDDIIGQFKLNSYYMGLNCREDKLKDVRVRQAINYAIDRDKIVEKILRNQAVVSHGPVPLGLNGYTEDNAIYEYNPEKARALLKEAGYKDGMVLTLYQNSDKEVLAVTTVIQHFLKKVGIEVNIIQRDWSAFKQAVNKGEADLFYLSWWADYPDAENFLYPVFHSDNFGSLGNRAFFSDSEIDGMLDKLHTTGNREAYTRHVKATEKAIIEAAPWCFLWHKKSYMVVQKWVKGYRTAPIYTIEKYNDIMIKKQDVQKV